MNTQSKSIHKKMANMRNVKRHTTNKPNAADGIRLHFTDSEIAKIVIFIQFRSDYELHILLN